LFGHLHDFEIYVDTKGQLELCKLKNDCKPIDWHLNNVPIYPLNTDGIDIWGQHFLIERIKITNYDDGIVPKPSNQEQNVPCTQNITVRDIETHFSVGMSVGSVPPRIAHACVKDILF
jgi:hypothetical protein